MKFTLTEYPVNVIMIKYQVQLTKEAGVTVADFDYPILAILLAFSWTLLNYFTLDFEGTWWRLFKYLVCIELDTI